MLRLYICPENNLDTIGLRMTYVNLTDEAIKYFTEIMSFEELKSGLRLS